MRALIQRVAEAHVAVENRQIASIGAGVLIFVCVMQDDQQAQCKKLAEKIAKLRMFKDAEGKMNRALIDVQAEALVISQFTLAADMVSGNRPGFSKAAAPKKGQAFYEDFITYLSQYDIVVKMGEFGANMQVSLINDGPATFWLEI